MTTFAQHLRAEMAARQMQSVELARLVGVTPEAVHYWRKGRHNLRVGHALKLARLFGRSVEEMFPES